MTSRIALLISLIAVLALVTLPALARAQSVPTSTPSGPSISAPASIAAPASGAAGARRNDGLIDLTTLNPISVIAGANDLLQRSGASGVYSGGGVGGGGGAGSSGSPRSSGLSGPINVMLLLTVITLVPSIMLMTTCFIRIVIVLGLLKQALGTQSLPPPQVLVGLAMFMTLAVMSPTLERIHREAIVPYNEGTISNYDQLWDRAKQPLRDFMFDQIESTGNWSSVYMMLNYRGVDTSDPESLTTDDVDMISLIPAFMLSELKTAFLIGFKVYLPFLVIDMVIASLLISMGMMMLPPVLISMPFKLLLFVLVDGWTLIVGSLLTSFVTHPTGDAVVSINWTDIETLRHAAAVFSSA